jgi:hypothetical protein
MPGAQRARSLVCKGRKHTSSHHGHAGNARHSPRNGFTVSFVLAPETGFIVSVPGVKR